MNKARRKLIAQLIERAEALIRDAETVRDEEQDYFDNMPESIQQADKGSKAEDCVQVLGDACEAAESLRDLLETALAD